MTNAARNISDMTPTQPRCPLTLNASITEFTNRLSDLAANNNALPKVIALKVEVAELRADMLAADNHCIRAGLPFSSERDPAFQVLTREVAALQSRVTASSPAPSLALEMDNTFLGLCCTGG
jgi:hypothetical protein